jgi:hypothetical protein
MHLKEGEEGTAGSDPRIRFSSGGPISLDPELKFVLLFLLQYFALDTCEFAQQMRILGGSRISLQIVLGSVADPGCLSRIPDPDYYPSRISYPRSKNNNKRAG